MRAVVTGASGNVGTAVVRAARSRGWSIAGVVRRPPDLAEPYDEVDWIACDLASDTAGAELRAALDGADAVIHLAWSINPGADEDPMWRTNNLGTRNVLEAAASAGVPRVVVASSSAAYSPAPRWSAIDENWATEGIDESAYSRGKAQLEKTLAAFAEKNPSVAVGWIRPCAIVQRNAGGEFAKWLLPPMVPAGALGQRWVPLPLWPGLRAQLVHSDDVADAVCRIVEQRAEGPFNLAAAPVLDAPSIAQIVNGQRVPIPKQVLAAGAWLAWRAGTQPLHPGWLALADRAPILDTTRARELLDWHPTHSSSEVLEAFVMGVKEGAGTASPALPRRVVRGLGSISWGRPLSQSQA